MSSRVCITFQPAGVTVWVPSGCTVRDAAQLAEIMLPAPCGGRGVCGSCGVRVLSGGLADPDEVEQSGLRGAPAGVRLACRARVTEAVEVRPIIAYSNPTPQVRPGEQEGISLVAGVDLGTTSVAAVLIDAAKGRELARTSAPNTQQTWGADVLTRIGSAVDGHGVALRDLAEESVLAALTRAAAVADVPLTRIERLVIAGNSAMAALIAGVDVTSLAAHPFRPPFPGGPLRPDSLLRAALSPGAATIILPPVAGFVGGDALAATIAAGMIDADAPALLVDFGTNAEIVLADAHQMVVASAAAGPAFEGGGVSCGGPAVEGAVVKVAITADEIVPEVIGGGEPLWFAGSGIVSAIAALRELGHIDDTGRIVESGPLSARFANNDDGVATMRIGSSGSENLTLTQLDVRTFQLAKAAVQAGVEAVLREAGVKASCLERVFIAGAFGTAIDPADLITLGVLPLQAAGRTRSAGNAALDGAAAIALEPSLEELGSRATCGAHHVELALDSGFADTFLRATALKPFDA